MSLKAPGELRSIKKMELANYIILVNYDFTFSNSTVTATRNATTVTGTFFYKV